MVDGISGSEVASETFSEINLDALNSEQVSTETNDSGTSSQGGGDDPFKGVEIDERYKGLEPTEALLRTLKSKYDKTTNDYQKLTRDYNKASQRAELLNQLFTDEGLFLALVNQVKPDLVKNVDYGVQIKEELKKQFGEGYKPSLTRQEAERDDPGGIDWKYYKKLDDLSNKFGENSGHSKNLKEYLDQRKAEQDLESEQMQASLETLKKEMKMGDEEAKAIIAWSEGLQMKDLVKIHRYLRKFSSAPGITQQPGDSVHKSQKEKYLDELFGRK
jgi:hypothetical protein